MFKKKTQKRKEHNNKKYAAKQTNIGFGASPGAWRGAKLTRVTYSGNVPEIAIFARV